MTYEVLSFEAAIDCSANYSKRHLILGNGFSIACRPDIFHYGSLYSRADFDERPKLQAAFEALGTQDFEEVIRHLEAGAKLLPIYASHAAAATEQMIDDAAALKEILIKTIAANHPHSPLDISEGEFSACRKFLSYFIGRDRKGSVFTLNYDLLLYWTLMHRNELDENPIDLERNDAFGNEEDNPDADYVVWQGEKSAHSANVLFLHGALHLFDAGSELQKFTWIRTDERLVNQSRAAIRAGKYPLFVAEGQTEKKKDKIRHNAYLYQGLKQLTANAQTKTHCVFIYGHSLADNDDHVWIRLGYGKFAALFISLYGDPNSPENQVIMRKAESISERRAPGYPLEIIFYDAQSAQVWG